MIDIKGLTKAAVLATLYNNSKQQGMGFLHGEAHGSMTEEQAQEEIDRLVGGHSADYPMVFPDDQKSLRFDYLHGRVMKVAIGGDGLEEWLYDRDNGEGAAERAIDAIR